MNYIKRTLRSIGVLRPDNKRDDENMRKFAQDYLKRDGIFMLRLISNNVGYIVSAEVLEGLWDQYNPEPRTPTTPKKKLHSAIPLNSLAERLESV